MEKYIDLFIMPVPKNKLKEYKKMSKASQKSWLKAGALEYKEFIGDDVPKGKTTSYQMSVKLKPGEVIIVGYAAYKSKKHRDQVMKKVHEDVELMNYWENMPFDGMRMIWGGFKKY